MWMWPFIHITAFYTIYAWTYTIYWLQCNDHKDGFIYRYFVFVSFYLFCQCLHEYMPNKELFTSECVYTFVRITRNVQTLTKFTHPPSSLYHIVILVCFDKRKMPCRTPYGWRNSLLVSYRTWDSEKIIMTKKKNVSSYSIYPHYHSHYTLYLHTWCDHDDDDDDNDEDADDYAYMPILEFLLCCIVE